MSERIGVAIKSEILVELSQFYFLEMAYLFLGSKHHMPKCPLLFLIYNYSIIGFNTKGNNFKEKAIRAKADSLYWL